MQLNAGQPACLQPAAAARAPSGMQSFFDITTDQLSKEMLQVPLLNGDSASSSSPEQQSDCRNAWFGPAHS